MEVAPICVGIPTYARGTRVLVTLGKILDCTPPPAEVLVHIDASDGRLEKDIREKFPAVRFLASPERVGPGGGRHRCIHASAQPFFVSFDDDSWPIDSDFFIETVRLFERFPEAAVLAATIYHRGAAVPARGVLTAAIPSFTGCGYALRTAAYREIRGNIDRPWAYGIEEVDVCLQLHAQRWQIVACESLRAFHDTELAHHKNPEVVAAAIQNVALLAFLRYPVALWPRALLQVANRILFSIRRGWYRGAVLGIVGIPRALASHAKQRHALPADAVRSYLRSRKPPRI
jgi:GT2 family glycosyltransferase